MLNCRTRTEQRGHRRQHDPRTATKLEHQNPSRNPEFGSDGHNTQRWNRKFLQKSPRSEGALVIEVTWFRSSLYYTRFGFNSTTRISPKIAEF
jgi:hypothetical protein